MFSIDSMKSQLFSDSNNNSNNNNSRQHKWSIEKIEKFRSWIANEKQKISEQIHELELKINPNIKMITS